MTLQTLDRGLAPLVIPLGSLIVFSHQKLFRVISTSTYVEPLFLDSFYEPRPYVYLFIRESLTMTITR